MSTKEVFPFASVYLVIDPASFCLNVGVIVILVDTLCSIVDLLSDMLREGLVNVGGLSTATNILLISSLLPYIPCSILFIFALLIMSPVSQIVAL